MEALFGPKLPGMLDSGKVVGALQVDQPSVSPFLVHGTLPLPQGYFLGDETDIPLALVDHLGQPVDTQLEVVARYPHQADGASVVEVLARVDVPPDADGSPLTFYIQEHSSPRALAPTDPSVSDFSSVVSSLPAPTKSLINQPGQLLLAAEDVFGNLYVLDLLHDSNYDQGARRTQRYGKVQSELRHHALLRPLATPGGSNGPLPHLFGVHAYVRMTAGDPVIELDLRLHNGADGSTPDNQALNEIYFKQVALLTPVDWFAVPSYWDTVGALPYTLGNFRVQPLITPNADGTMHFMPKLGQMERRLVLAPTEEFPRAKSHADREGVAFAVRGPGGPSAPQFWSWWNTNTSGYFPQRHLLPRVETVPMSVLEQELAWDFKELEGHLQHGTGDGIYPILSGALGWAHPYGAAYGGMTGGDDIEFFWGIKTLLSSSRSGYQKLEVRHRMNTERMPNAFYRSDGEPSRLEDWLVVLPDKTYVPHYFYMHPTGSGDPWGFGQAPTEHTDHVVQNGLQPSYEIALESYEHIDIQHLVRYTGPAKALAWIGNDSLAKDDLELQAELFNQMYHQYDNSFYGHVQGTGMKADRQYIEAQPGVGFPFGRGEGWGIDTMAAAYALGSDSFRTRKFPWFQDVADLVGDGQSKCSGFIQATVYGKLLGGNYRGRQVIETSIVEHALFGAMRSVLAGADMPRAAMLRDSIEDSIYAMIRPESWDPALGAPYSQLAVAPKDLTLLPYCGPPPSDGFSPFTDSWQQWSSLAYGLELTGDAIFITYAEKMMGQPLANLATDSNLDNLGNRASLRALVEYILDSI